MRNIKNDSAYRGSLSPSGRVGLNMASAIAKARCQIDVECFKPSDRAQADEIIMIIAEIYRLPGDWEVQIDGGKLPAAMVAEVYESLREEHVEAVMREFEKITHEIRFKKSYLRTALYNEAFIHTSRELNEIMTNAKARGYM